MWVKQYRNINSLVTSIELLSEHNEPVELLILDKPIERPYDLTMSLLGEYSDRDFEIRLVRTKQLVGDVTESVFHVEFTDGQGRAAARKK